METKHGQHPKSPASTSRKRMWAGDFSSLLWLPSLSVGEEVTMAFTLFVAVLMFVQKGAGNAEATMLAALVLCPWLLKNRIRRHWQQAIPLKTGLVVCELLSALVFWFMAVNFRKLNPTMLTATLTAQSAMAMMHHLFSTGYRHRHLDSEHRIIMGHTLSILQHLIVLLAYGATVIMVGTLQIYFRQFSSAWAMAFRGCAVLMLTLSIYHLLVLRPIKSCLPGPALQPGHRTWMEKLRLPILLLPQGLMFHTRTLFLIDAKEEGGLGSTLQEIGFAQGTVGMIAFILGFSLFHRFHNRLMPQQLSLLTRMAMGASPVVYLLFSFFPPNGLGQLCIGTFTAQFFFGIGLSATGRSIGFRQNKGYRLLFEPAILTSMTLSWAMSGYLSHVCGYPLFFLLNSILPLLLWHVSYCQVEEN